MNLLTMTKYFVFSTLFLLFVDGCAQKPAGEENREVKMVYTDWSESVAITHLAAVLLEEKMDYRVVLKLTDVEVVYREIAEGDADIFADAWLPETHQPYMNEYPGLIETIGITYPEARTGFVVPEYSPFETIADLETYQHPVIGIDEGAGIMQKAKLAFQKYALPNELLNLSEDEMVRHLEDSVKRRKNIVITGWEPHWIFARYDLRFLDDPDNIFGEKETIYTISRKGMEEDHPRAVRFFERMQLTERQLNSLVYHVRLSEDPRQGAKNWVDENEYIVNQWVRNLRPERKKIM